VCSAELQGKDIGLDLGSRERDAGLEASDDGDGVTPVTDFVHVGGDKEIDAKTGRKDRSEIEGLRENADDGDGLIIEIDGLAEDIFIARELLLPELIGKHGNERSAFLVLFGKKRAAECGSDAEGVEEIVGDHNGLNVLRIAVAGHVVFAAAPEGLVAGDFLEGLRVALEFFEGANVVRGAGEAAFAVIACEPNELLRMGERKRTKKEGVDDGKDDDVGADAESENENGDQREGTVLAERAEVVAEILHESFDHGEAPGVTMNFFGLLGTTEIDEGLATSLLRGHAGFEIVGDGFIEVGGHFSGEVGVELVSAEEGDDAMEESEVHE